MPELPEVERGRRLARAVARGRTIVKVTCARDAIVFEGVGAARFHRALVGRLVVEVCRRGKHLWLELDRRPWPCVHFGMTGALRTPGDTPLRLASSPRQDDSGWPPRFVKLHLVFDDGGELAVVNKRRFGRIRLRDDPAREPPICDLGFDPLLDLPSPKAFAKLLAGRTAMIKPLLMDQRFAAGVGNWIADEVLYQARIDPRRPAGSLSGKEAGRLRGKLKQIIDRAVAVEAIKARLPRTWLFHRRWHRNGAERTARGERIERFTLAGRTTAWVPQVQR